VKALVIEHDPLSTPERVGAHLERRGLTLDHFVVVDDIDHPEVEAVFPEDGFDVLVVMGAPWSVYDPRVQGWVRPELDLLADAASRGVPSLNICFGAQALSVALGGEVRASESPEYGWTGIDSAVGPIADGPWFQFHHDEFTVPPGGVHLAGNGSGIQAYRVGRSLALQFHPEVTAELISSWCDAGGDRELSDAGVDPGALIEETRRRVPESQEALETMLDWWLDDFVG
jgi:GMP synthase-like glutamine amidotransferase